jgi:nucleotide-binding universal stress UspA family protein
MQVPQRHKTVNNQIVVGVDDSPAGHSALEWAATRAAHLHIPLTLVRVVPGPWYFRHASRYLEAMNQGAALLASQAHRVSVPDIELTVATTLRTGDTARTLRTLSREADMIVVGTDRRPDRHGDGFGSISFQTAAISKCVVTVVPPTSPEQKAGVVVGTSGSAGSAVAVERAALEALRLSQDLTVVHACEGHDSPTAEGSEDRTGGKTAGACLVLSSAAARLARSHPGLKVHPVLETGRSPAQSLIAAGSQALLLVLGGKGPEELEALIGSVARDVLMDTRCPTLITRPAPTRNPQPSERPNHR